MAKITDDDLLLGIKSRLSVTGEYHDATLKGLIEDVKAVMVDSGIDKDVVDDNVSVGCIARGVADLWNFGAGEGKLSIVFLQRVIQLSRH